MIQNVLQMLRETNRRKAQLITEVLVSNGFIIRQNQKKVSDLVENLLNYGTEEVEKEE